MYVWCGVYVCVCVFIPDGATEQHWILKNDGQPGSQSLQRQLADINAINNDLS